jgi:uncharacterized Ntn-hydrolase superfamily protein
MPFTRWSLALLFAVAAPAHATYSIIACDAATRACGVAVQTNNLAVGASVPYAQAGVGAVVSQFETNPHYGPQALALMAGGAAPSDALAKILADDGDFEGETIEARQVALVRIDGATATHTGSDVIASPWAGARSGNGYSAQGNGLAGPQVVEAMERTFLAAQGPLAERLLAALVAGERAGGQTTGRESAALLVHTTDGWPIDIDLRVDHAADPIAALQSLYGQYAARQDIVDARRDARHGNVDAAANRLIGAVAKAPTWPRAWLSAARVAIEIERPELALQYLATAFAQNDAWRAAELGAGRYAALGANPLFARWIDEAVRESALDALRTLEAQATPAARTALAARLAEANRPAEALKALTPRDDTPHAARVRIDALVALGRVREARAAANDAAKRWPDERRLAAQRQRSARLHE